MQVVAILVGPQHPGNVGAAARAAANFGVADLRFVAPECDVRAKEAYDRAIHAKDLLDNARTFPDLKSALEGVSLSIGTTARKALAANHFLRKPSDIRDAMAELAGWDGTLAWVFGREDAGLTGPEVDLLDQLVTIPTSEYWSLNLSHAVGICCYESFRLQSQSITPERTLAPGALVAMNEAWDAIVHEAEDREWRKRVASGVWRKVVGRSRPDTFEVHNIMGILANTLKRFGHPDYKSAASDLRLGQEGKLIAGKAARGQGKGGEEE
ncbi:MAG: tRNA/rRNA methyltransferase [Thermoplasmata archaeon]|nr:tRNA/rRNA methyltransferase [Thermoplasmata archaeon]